jgi:hypothetical protein
MGVLDKKFNADSLAVYTYLGHFSLSTLGELLANVIWRGK